MNALYVAITAQAATTFIVPQGGTGRTSFSANAIIKGNGTGALTASGVSIDSSNNISGANNLVKRNDIVTGGPAGSGANYITDGTADDVQINQADVACNAASSCSAVDLMCTTFTIVDVISLHSSVDLFGCGQDQTITRPLTVTTRRRTVQRPPPEGAC